MLPPQVLDAFDALATAQRGAPERAMEVAREALGGGVLTVAIEHTGDLTNRMAQRDHILHDDAGYDYVAEKVDKVLRLMRPRRGFISFEEEHQRNMASSARYHGVPLETYQTNANRALGVYAKAHRRLRVHNSMQLFAREAAVRLGEQRFGGAVEMLERLEAALETPEKWAARATEYTLTPEGFVRTVP